MYRLATGFFRRLYFPIKGKIRVAGLENLPHEGGLLVASNHMSHLDPPALAVTLKDRRLRAMAKEELWKNKLFGAVIQAIGAFPVKRGEADTESIRKCIEILKGGEAVIVFPEGTRNDGETMLPLSQGVAMLAKRAGVPVLPVGIAGTQILMPCNADREIKQKGRSHAVKVVIGQPFRYEDVTAGSANEREARKAFLDELERRILSLTAEAGIPLKSAKSIEPKPAPRDPAEKA